MHIPASLISLKARQSCHGILSFCSAISVPEKVRVWWYKRGGGGKGSVVPQGGGGVDGVSSLRNRPPGGGGGPSSLGWDTGGGGDGGILHYICDFKFCCLENALFRSFSVIVPPPLAQPS